MSRLFVSVEFDDAIKKVITDDIIPQFTSQMIKAKPTPMKNMHVTLKFIGERSDNDINDIIDILDRSHEDIGPFDVIVKGIGAFPKKYNPRIIWAGLSKEYLSLLSKNIDNNLNKINIKKDNKPFSPHITIFRVKEVLNNNDVNDVIESLSKTMIGTQRVSSYNLMKSTLTPSGPIYKSIKEFKL